MDGYVTRALKYSALLMASGSLLLSACTSGGQQPTPTPTYAPATATATATLEPSPTQSATPAETSRYGTPTPIQTRFENGFYLTSPCGGECTAEKYTHPTGEKLIRFRQVENTPIKYSGEHGYYVQVSGFGENMKKLSIYDDKGYIVEYILREDATPLTQGPADLRRGDQIGVSKGTLSSNLGSDVNYTFSLKRFTERVRGFIDEFERARQTPRLELYEDDFVQSWQ